MNEFFVTVFGGGTYYQYRLKDLLANSFNGIVNDEYAFMGINFYFPIIYEDEKYFLYDRNADWTFSLNGERINEKKEIRHGDYILLKGKDVLLSMLILDCKKRTIGLKAYIIEKGEVAFIGRQDDMNIILDYSLSISRKHASIRVDNDGAAYIDDLCDKTGVFVNSKKVSSCRLNPSDEIYIMGTAMIYYDNCLLIPDNIKVKNLKLKDGFKTVIPVDEDEREIYVRTPRIQKSLENGSVQIDPPTAPQKIKQMPFILVAGPSMTMSLAMLASLGVTISNALNGGNYKSVITSGVMSVSMLLGAILWPKLTRNYNKKQIIENEQHRQKRYHEYLANKHDEIKLLYDRNTRIWNETLYPSVSNLIKTVCEQNRHLWERSITDEDFLGIRLGLGEKKFEVDIVVKKKGFELEDDPLEEEGYKIAEKFSELKNIPIVLSLKNHRVCGVVGDYVNIAKIIIANLVSLYAPEELKIVMVYNRYREAEFAGFNDISHMWSSDMKTRYVATTEAEAYDLFARIDEYIQSREESLEKEDLRSPHFVVLIFDRNLIANVAFKRVLVNSKNNLGVSSVFFGERFNKIPKECVAIVQKSSEICGLYIKNENNNRLIEFTCDTFTDEDMKNLVRGLSLIRVKKEKSSMDIPESISFLDVFQVANVDALDIESHWNTNNSNKTLAAPVGVMAGNEKFYLDIHEKYHGCHGLVAGTTGSGKSEFLQAYILSMMINYSPKEVAFVLVDFKGGDMARPFLKSPHLAATISNLSGNTLYRALVSLEAEVKNRQKIFNQAASKLSVDKLDINSYQKYFKEGKINLALPHLIIVIDEFAQLKMQNPEFMQKLIGISQVGRSLGIHLILATQKPSGVVDPQIWSNSRFKICLKVMDKQDSMDMINKPFAAMIKTPGRAYVQVGYDEIFNLIQSGYSGAEYIPQEEFTDEESITVSMVNWTGENIRQAKDSSRGQKTNLSQLEAIMKKISLLGDRKNIHARKLWLDPLKEKLRLNEIDSVSEDYNFDMVDKDYPGKAKVAIMDLPHIQKQIPYAVDFVKDGHMVIYGASGTGKSTFVQSIFYAMAIKYSTKKLNTLVLDFNGGSLIGLSKMPHCISYVTDDEKEIKQVFKMLNSIISKRRKEFSQRGCANYESFISSGESDMPVILVALDNYAAFREKMYRSEDILLQIVGSAAACGIYFLITGNSKGAIYYKVTDHIKNKVVFNMNDTGSYRDILDMRVPVFPENIKGRALVVNENNVVEIQVGVAFDTESESSRNHKISKVYEEMKKDFKICMDYDLSDYEQEKEDQEEEAEINFSYERPEMKNLVLDDDFIKIGTNIKTGEDIGISKDSSREFFICNKNFDTLSVSEIINKFIKSGYEVKIISEKRNYDFEDEYVENLDDFIYSYCKPCQRNLKILFIDGFSDFYQKISDQALDVFVKAVREKSLGKIITIDDMEEIMPYRDTELYLRLIKCPDGMVMGGSANNELATCLNSDFYRINEEYRKISLEMGQAILYHADTAAYVQLGGAVNE